MQNELINCVAKFIDKHIEEEKIFKEAFEPFCLILTIPCTSGIPCHNSSAIFLFSNSLNWVVLFSLNVYVIRFLSVLNVYLVYLVYICLGTNVINVKRVQYY